MNRSRLGAIAGRELGAQLASPLFAVLLLWLLFLASALNPLAMVPPGEAVVDGVRAATNSAHALAPAFAIGALFAYTFFAALLAAAAALRDEEAGVEELLRALPLTRAERLAGKLAGVLGALGLALAFHVAALAAFRELPAVLGLPSAAGTFRAGAYLLPAFAFAVPWILLVTVAAFAAAERTRRPMAAYVVPIVLFATTLLLFWNYHPAEISQQLDRLLAVVDPSGIRWLDRFHFAVDRGPSFYNEAPLRFDLLFGLNRLLTVGAAAVAIAALLRAHERTGQEGRRRGPRVDPVVDASSATFRTLGDLAMSGRPRTARGRLDGALAIARVEWTELRRPPVLLLFTVVLALAVFEVAATPVDLFGSPLRPTAGGFATDAIPIATLLVALYLLFAVAESWQREETSGFAPLLHASPVSDGEIALGKGAAHGAVSLWLLCALLATGLTSLALAGEALDLAPLALVFGLVLPPTFILWIAFVSALHALTGSRAATLGLGLTALVATGALFLAGEMSWVSNWPLWGALRWTDFALLPLNGSALLWNRFLALAAAALLFALATFLRRRREPDTLALAARRRPAAIAGTVLRFAPLILLPFAMATLLAIRIENGAEGGAAERFRAAAVQESAALWSRFEPPAIEHLDLRLDLDPALRTVAAEGEIRLENRGKSPLVYLPFTVGRSLSPVRWTIDGVEQNATRTTGVDLLELDPPLAPGSRVRVGFAHQVTSPLGYTRNGGGMETFILPAAVSLSTARGELLPEPGFAPRSGEASGSAVRLPDGAAAPWAAAEARRRAFTFRLEVTAPESFRISAAGDLVDESVSNGRRRTLWRSEVPVVAIAVAAARYSVAQRDGEAVYHLPGHAAASDGMLATLAAARRRYSDWFHPYPWRELRIAETPDLTAQATAYPAHLALAESFGFRSRSDASAGLPFRVVAHEAAHQWWGHLVAVAEGPGTGLLVEGMANYATLLLLEAELGIEARAAYARDLERLYLERRRASAERPILETQEWSAADEAVLSFRGALVLERLQSELGAERMFAALRGFVDSHRAGEMLATPDDLLRALRAQAPSEAAFEAIVSDWLAGTALPELRISDARLEPEARGYRLRARVENVGSGSARIELAALAAASGDAAGEAARLVIPVEPGRPAVVDWRLAFRPARLVVDPDARLLQLHRDRAVLDFGPAGV